MDTRWIAKAAFYELLAKTFSQTTREFAEFVKTGEYAAALEEVATACAITPEAIDKAMAALEEAGYEAMDNEELFHHLRRAYTRLFIGGPRPLVSPFAGVWWAKERGVGALLMVNKESLAVEDFMKDCGITKRTDANEPTDSLNSELEFMQYLSSAIASEGEGSCPARLCGGKAREAYEDFYDKHLHWFVSNAAEGLAQHSDCAVYTAASHILGALPKTAL